MGLGALFLSIQKKGFLLICAILACLFPLLWRSYRLHEIKVGNLDYLALHRWRSVDTLLGGIDGVRILGLPDVNRATAVDLQRIKGLGKVLSRRIILYREALGGFHSFSQLSEVERMPSSVIARIEEGFSLSAPYRLLGLSSSQAEWRLHPYISDSVAFRLSRIEKIADLRRYFSHEKALHHRLGDYLEKDLR